MKENAVKFGLWFLNFLLGVVADSESVKALVVEHIVKLQAQNALSTLLNPSWIGESEYSVKVSIPDILANEHQTDEIVRRWGNWLREALRERISRDVVLRVGYERRRVVLAKTTDDARVNRGTRWVL